MKLDNDTTENIIALAVAAAGIAVLLIVVLSRI